MINRNAVVLLSGGLDSTTTLAIAKSQGYDPYGLTFSYGQRHKAELDAAEKISVSFKLKKHMVVPLDLRLFGGSSLTSDIPVPKDRIESDISSGVPTTYVPARNTIFLSFALAWAEVLGIGDIFIGVNVLDYSGYPDCRSEFINAYEKMANLATKGAVEGKIPVKIHTPLIQLTKAQIIAKGLSLGVDYSITSTCYDPWANGEACGKCDACFLRIKGFKENGLNDPIIYKKES